MTDPALVAIITEMIAFQVRGGNTPEDAQRALYRLASNDVVDAAYEEHKRRCGEIFYLKDPATLHGIRGHWYSGPTDKDRYWPALEWHLVEKEGWQEDAITLLDDASSKIVAHLDPPGHQGFATRGLVVGYVQSGKTTNFTALIAKAADVGYRCFFVLSGTHNVLRNQTQDRLTRQLSDVNSAHWHRLTDATSDRLPRGGHPDAFFASTVASDQRVLGVFKKNATVLRRLRTWLKRASPTSLAAYPILIIDDESDLASVNTNEPDMQPTRINAEIRDILALLPCHAFVGYTATPFANMLIDPTYPDDLYPRDFIISLSAPDAYFGTERIFGRDRRTADEDDDALGGMRVICEVPETDGDALRKPTASTPLPKSLDEALRYFVLATAARRARGQVNDDSRMLIHTSMKTAVHELTRPMVTTWRSTMRAALSEDSGMLSSLQDQWDDMHGDAARTAPNRFVDFAAHLATVVEEMEVVVRNSLHREPVYEPDRVRYEVVIGGNILSRGVTLDGLVVSYFLRTASAYDTLLQMGRWFGYRSGYEDLPRIWMTQEMQEYFAEMAVVEDEIRQDIRRYEREEATPLQFGVRIRTHPKLAITAKAKMRAAVPASMSFNGTAPQTIMFHHRSAAWLQNNLEAGRALLRSAADEVGEQRFDGRVVFRGVPLRLIDTFLEHYRIHENSADFQSVLVRDYINRQNDLGNLLSWDVAVVGVSNPNAGLIDLIPGRAPVPLLIRSRLRFPDSPANLKAIASRAERERTAAYLRGEAFDPTGDLPVQILENGVLLLYPIDRRSAPRITSATSQRGNPRVALDAVEHVLGMCIVFPKTDDGTPVRYVTVRLPDTEIEDIDDLVDPEREA